MDKQIYNRIAVIKATTVNKQTGKKTVKQRSVNAYDFFNSFVNLAKHTPKLTLSINTNSVNVNYKNIEFKGEILNFI